MSREVAHFYQDKDESISRTLDWTADLNGSTISGAPTWTVPSELTTVAQSNTTTTTTIQLAGAKPGKTYQIECKITSVAGEIPAAHILLTGED